MFANPLLLLPLLMTPSSGTRPQKPLEVVCTIPDLGSLARSIGGDQVRVSLLVPPGSDPHMVIAKASMLLRVSRADALISMGLNYEHAFLPALMQKTRNPRVIPGGPGYLQIGKDITPLEVPKRLSRSEGVDLHPLGNPHFNLDPELGRIAARDIRDLFQSLRPEQADFFEANWKEWDQDAQERIVAWKKVFAPLAGRKIVVYHRSWSYFVKRFGIVIAAEVEPKPGLPPTPRHLARVAQTIREEQVKVLVMEPWYNERNVSALESSDSELKVVKIPTTCGSTRKTREYLDYIDFVVHGIADALAG